MKKGSPIVITGFMGCGKSKVARALARHLDLVMVDLDESITAEHGRTPAQLIIEDGERAFRSIESDALRELLRSGHAGVIALGGGAWIEQINRDLIEQYSGVSVWLDVPFDTCWSRIETSTEDRPLGRTREQAAARYERRKPIYELATIRVRVSGDEEVEDLISRLEHELSA